MKNILSYTICTLILISCTEEVIQEEILPTSRPQQNNFLKEKKVNNLLTATTEKAKIPATIADDFIWGINGHFSGYPDYTWSGSANLQAKLIKELQLDYYRVNIKTDPNGNLINPVPFNNLLAESSGYFKLLAVFQLTDYDPSMSIQEAYLKGYSKTFGFASTYGNNIDYYALGNERDVRILDPARGEGSSPTDYYYQDFLVLASFFKGMISAIDIADPGAKTIINCSGWKKWGYYELLDQEGVNYDIIGWHWYSNMTNEQVPLNIWPGDIDVLSYLYATYNKPIWITEINRYQGTYGGTEEEQAFWIKNFVDHLDNRNYVKAFFVYELFDENHLGLSNPEANYGLIKWNMPKTNNFEYKPAFKSYKFKIEETKFGYEDYVYSLYLYVSMREEPINDPGMSYWVNEFQNSTNLSEPLGNYLKDAGYKPFIKMQYNHLLDRNSDPSGLNYWVNEMKNGVLREEVIARFCGGSQFWQLSGSNNLGFLERVYQKLHGRELDQDGRDYFLNQLNQGVSKELIVKEILSSREYLRNFIDKQYVLLLRRQSDPEGLDYWYNKMLDGLSQQGLIKEFLMSQQFWNKAIKEGYERRTAYTY